MQNLEFRTDKDILYINLDGRIDASNAADVEGGINEIRKANPFESYHDKRVEKFIDIFNELYKNFINYSKSKGNIWEYTYIKILNIFQIEYQYVTVTTIGTKKSEADEQNQQQKEETKPPTLNVTKEDNSDNNNILSNNDEL